MTQPILAGKKGGKGQNASADDGDSGAESLDDIAGIPESKARFDRVLEVRLSSSPLLVLRLCWCCLCFVPYVPAGVSNLMIHVCAGSRELQVGIVVR